MQASLVAILVLGVILWLTLAAFQPLMVGILVATLSLLAWSALTERGKRPLSGVSVDALLVAVVLSGCTMLALQPQLIYAEVPNAYHALRGVLAAAAGLFFLGAFVALVRREPGRQSRWDEAITPVDAGLAFVALLLFVARVLVPFASPEPVIDVFVNNTLGVDHLLDGRNPYRMEYPDVYHGAYSFTPALGYPPGSLLLLTPFRLLGDVRLASAFADLCTCVILLRWMRGSGFGRARAWLIVLVWLSFPASLFVYEQAWLDPLLVPLWLALVLAIERRHWVFAGLALGAMIAVKQYAVFFALATAVYAYRVGGARALGQGTAAAIGLVAALVVPFAIGDPDAFYVQVAGTFIERGFRGDTLSFAALLAYGLGRDMPGPFLLAATVSGLACWAGWLWRRVEPDDADWVAAAAFGFALAVLFGKQAGCNYYYLLAALLLTHMIRIALREGQAADTLER